MDQARDTLLQCATPESVIRLRDTELRGQEEAISNRYYKKQTHGSLLELLRTHLVEQEHQDGAFIQVRTHLVRQERQQRLLCR